MEFDRKVLDEKELENVFGGNGDVVTDEGILIMGTRYDANGLLGLWNNNKTLLQYPFVKAQIKPYVSDIYAQFEKDGVTMPADMDAYLKSL